jgi:hypothetical protein
MRLTDKQKKGIDLVVNALKKRYPEIISWEYDPVETSGWVAFVFIKLKVKNLSLWRQRPLDDDMEVYYSVLPDGYKVCIPKELCTAIRYRALTYKIK